MSSQIEAQGDFYHHNGVSEYLMQRAVVFVIWTAILAVGLGFVVDGVIWPSAASMNYIISGATFVAMGAYALWKDFLAGGLGNDGGE
ncbi:MAG: hypothetical protein WCA56_04135 [Xanthobacteraceae bacterium]